MQVPRPGWGGIRDVPSAFRWIIANHFPAQPEHRPRSVRIVDDKGTCTKDECALDENVVTVFESKVAYWYRPYSQPGAPPFAAWRLSGLFDFMRAVIWQSLDDDSKTGRILTEPGLGEEELQAVRRHASLEAEAKQLGRDDIERFLSDRPPLRRLYLAVLERDSAGLERCIEEADGDIERLGTQSVRDLILLINAGNEKAAKSNCAGLITSMMLLAMEGQPIEVRLGWRSPEYSRHVHDSSEHFKTLSRLATRWFAGKFERICLSEEVLDLGRRLFFAEPGENEQAYRAQVSSFVAGVRGAGSNAASR
ncbi:MULTISPECIES: hypothetical protein [unclassified Rhizobacter]|uniref:hypothetical protein n=1 Tax=unclassified Rhizobacter TaxID=2640088 RepID=UPI0006FE3B48|nr:MULTISPECIES: hypothetical protein [unclassified Rhizobacter]KQU67934.1 hypothetical protein ASC88_08220 [Rhizobacter sp. Root29]KQW15179.1 hypothetical protein ASC98_13695 [Rhizobacter sp. Root1238]KRB24343.1 hypothetical protein ASE08_17680 [Rhizobacter sp. Root16D2]